MKNKARPCDVRGERKWYIDVVVDGRRRRRFFTTRGDADAALDAHVRERIEQAEAAPLPPGLDPEVTLRGFAESWLTERKPTWRARTYASNRDLLRLHVYPFPVGDGRTLGGERVRAIGAAHVIAVVSGLRQRGYAINSTRLVFRVLSAVLASAHAKGLLTRDPLPRATVATQIKPLLRPEEPTEPDHEAGHAKAFAPAEAKQFLATARTESPLHRLYVTGFLAGLRLGELCGLRLEDDTSETRADGTSGRVLKIRWQLGQRTSMLAPELLPPKSKAGRRSVDVGADLGVVLDQIAAERKALSLARAWRPVPPWMFVTSNGTPYSQRNIERDFRRVLEKAFPKAHKDAPAPRQWLLSPHGMRHTYASLLAAQGRNMVWLMQQLGHSSIKVTIDLYGSAHGLRDQAAADALGNSLVGNTAGNTRAESA